MKFEQIERFTNNAFKMFLFEDKTLEGGKGAKFYCFVSEDKMVGLEEYPWNYIRYAGNVHDGYRHVVNRNNCHNYFNVATGEFLSETWFYDGKEPSNGFVRVKQKNNKWNIIRLSDKMFILENWADFIGDFEGDPKLVFIDVDYKTKEPNWFLMDTEGNLQKVMYILDHTPFENMDTYKCYKTKRFGKIMYYFATKNNPDIPVNNMYFDDVDEKKFEGYYWVRFDNTCTAGEEMENFFNPITGKILFNQSAYEITNTLFGFAIVKYLRKGCNYYNMRTGKLLLKDWVSHACPFMENGKAVIEINGPENSPIVKLVDLDGNFTENSAVIDEIYKMMTNIQ